MCKLSCFDQFKSEILAEVRRVKIKDFEDMVYREEVTYHETIDILDIKYTAGSTNGYTLPPSIDRICDLNLMLKSLLPNELKLDITIYDIRLRSNLRTIKTIKFSRKKLFGHTTLGFTQSHSGPSNDLPKRYFQKITNSCKNERPINITAIEPLIKSI